MRVKVRIGLLFRCKGTHTARTRATHLHLSSFHHHHRHGANHAASNHSTLDLRSHTSSQSSSHQPLSCEQHYPQHTSHTTSHQHPPCLSKRRTPIPLKPPQTKPQVPHHLSYLPHTRLTPFRSSAGPQRTTALYLPHPTHFFLHPTNTDTPQLLLLSFGRNVGPAEYEKFVEGLPCTFHLPPSTFTFTFPLPALP